MSSEGELNLHGWRNGTAGQTGSSTRSTLGDRIPWTLIEWRWYMNARQPRGCDWHPFRWKGPHVFAVERGKVQVA